MAGWSHQDAVDFERADLLAATIDDLLEPSGQVQIAVAVKGALIAGAEPAMPFRGEEALHVGVGFPS